MNMKLSNTLLINKDLLPSYNNAFTLAEVLITLTILGVVAAITIPSLINRQSEVAAKTKIKKAIANFENVAAVYMAENESTDLGTGATSLATKYNEYFKVVDGTSAAAFTTSDGVYWNIAANQATVCDSATSPTFCVQMWAGDSTVNTDNKGSYENLLAAPGGLTPKYTTMKVKDFMAAY